MMMIVNKARLQRGSSTDEIIREVCMVCEKKMATKGDVRRWVVKKGREEDNERGRIMACSFRLISIQSYHSNMPRLAKPNPSLASRPSYSYTFVIVETCL